MTQHRTEQVAALLQKAGEAHHIYEQTQLKGVYDKDWPAWYAAWALEHGLNELLDTDLNADALAFLLVDINDAHQQSDSGENWAEFTAAQLVETYQR